MGYQFGNNLKYLRLKHGIEQYEIADRAGLKSTSGVSDWEQGVRLPKVGVIAELADFFGVTMDDLMYVDLSREEPRVTNLFPIPKTRIPLIGSIAAGEPVLAVQNIEEYIDIKATTGADFCLRVEGDSMIGAGIHSGDIVFIRQQPEVEDGEIAAVLIDEEATLKKVYKIGEVIQLRAENPKYPPITLNGEKNVRILGKAVSRLTKI